MKVSISYTNWQGETGTRTILPIQMYWGQTEYHKDPQWLLLAYDEEKQAPRTFAMKDIHSWHRVHL